MHGFLVPSLPSFLGDKCCNSGLCVNDHVHLQCDREGEGQYLLQDSISLVLQMVKWEGRKGSRE